MAFLGQYFICNKLTAVQYTVAKKSKNSLAWRKWRIICQYMFIFGKAATF